MYTRPITRQMHNITTASIFPMPDNSGSGAQLCNCLSGSGNFGGCRGRVCGASIPPEDSIPSPATCCSSSGSGDNDCYKLVHYQDQQDKLTVPGSDFRGKKDNKKQRQKKRVTNLKDRNTFSLSLSTHSVITAGEPRRPCYPVAGNTCRGSSPETPPGGGVSRHETGMAFNVAFQSAAPYPETHHVPSFEASLVGAKSQTATSAPRYTPSSAHNFSPSLSTALDPPSYMTKALLIHDLPRKERLGNILNQLEDSLGVNIVGAYWQELNSDQPKGALVIHLSSDVAVENLWMSGYGTTPLYDSPLLWKTAPDVEITGAGLDNDVSCSTDVDAFQAFAPLPYPVFETSTLPTVDSNIGAQSAPYGPGPDYGAQFMAHPSVDMHDPEQNYEEFHLPWSESDPPPVPAAADPASIVIPPTPPQTLSPPSRCPESAAHSPGPSSTFPCMPAAKYGNVMAFATSRLPLTENIIYSFVRKVEQGDHRQLRYQKIDDAVTLLDFEFVERAEQALRLAIDDAITRLDTEFAERAEQAMRLAGAKAEEEIL